jgi:Tol biopolymer transport system component
VLEGSTFLDQPALSPDGKWLAYRSAESGLPQVYIAPFPTGNGKWQVSTNGGVFPRWRRDGRELFYLSLDSKLMTTEVAEQKLSLSIWPSEAAVPG